MFPGAENKKEKKKGLMEFPARKSIFSCFHKKCFARCQGGSFSRGFLLLSILQNVQKLKHYFLKMLMMI